MRYVKLLAAAVLVALALCGPATPDARADLFLFENAKVVRSLGPDTFNNANETGTYADTAGFHKLTILVVTGFADTSWDLYAEECATSGGSYAAITGAALTQVASGRPSLCYAIELNLNARLRYIRPHLKTGNGATGVPLTCTLILTGARYSPTTTTEMGLQERIRP